MAEKLNMQRDVYEGWTPTDFVMQLQPQLDMIMTGQSWLQPFKTKKDLVAWIKENQPYYKKPIPEVNTYFAKRYNLR